MKKIIRKWLLESEFPIHGIESTEVEDSTRLKADLGLDSLDLLEIFSDIEIEFNIEIEENYDDITFGELIDLILKYGVENGK